MPTQTNIPQLRFPEFTGDWEKKKLGEVVSNKSGKYNPEKETQSIKCIELEHLASETCQLLGYIDGRNSFSIKNKFDKGDVLFGKLRPYLKKFLLAPFDGVCSSEIWVLKGINISNDFLFRIIQTDAFIDLANQTSGSKMPRADWQVLENGIFSFPTLPEQTKIASFLTAVDEKIQALKKKLSLLEQYKKGVMQQIFSQTLRFKDENGKDFPDWEEKKVKDLFKVTRGDVLAMLLVSDEIEIDHIYPVYSSQTKNRGLAGYYNEYLFEDAITWTTDGAGAGDVNFREGKFYCTNVCGVLLSEEGYANLFMAELLNSVSRKYVSYVGNPKLMNNVMAEISIIIPVSVQEQQKISDFLNSLNLRIKQLEVKIAKTEIWKKGLLQKMFV